MRRNWKNALIIVYLLLDRGGSCLDQFCKLSLRQKSKKVGKLTSKGDSNAMVGGSIMGVCPVSEESQKTNARADDPIPADHNWQGWADIVGVGIRFPWRMREL